MSPIIVKKKIPPFNQIINVNGDKSLSIRWALLASQAKGRSRAYNILRSLDVLSTLSCLKKLGVKVKLKKKYCEIIGKGLNKFQNKKTLTINAGNSGTLGRLILGLLIHHKSKVKLVGDRSLSKRDFSRVVVPLKKFGAKFNYKSNYKLPIEITGTDNSKPISYYEKRGSAQCKSAVMLAAINTKGETTIKAKKSRDHTENIFKYLRIPIFIKKKKLTDEIVIKGQKSFKAFKYKIPSDPSSCAFFIVLTLLSKNSELKIKNVNINESRIGFIKVLNKMGAKIKMMNIKKKFGEKQADIYVKSQSKLKKINCSPGLTSNLIDEFLIIFLVAAKAKGVSSFFNLEELNKKESPRLKIGSKLLIKMGIKNKMTKNSIKIFGNPNIYLKKNIRMGKYLKDHRVFMTSVIAACTFGGSWTIEDPSSYKSSFPSFLKILKKLGYKFKLI